MMLPPTLIESIYEAALDHTTAGRMLERVSEAIPSSLGLITEYDGGELRPVGIVGVAGEFEADVIQIMLEQHQHSLWTDAMTAERGSAVVFDGPVPFQALKRTDFYADVLRPLEVAHGIGMDLSLGEGRWLRLGLGRGRRGGIYTPDEAALFQACAIHLRRALAVSERFDVVAQLRRMELTALDRMATAALLVDGQGRLLLANRAAQRLAAKGALLLKDGSAPACSDRAAAAAFRAAVMGAATGLAPAPLRFRGVEGSPLILISAPLGSGSSQRLAEAGASGHPFAALVIHGAIGEEEPPTELLRSLFDLTPTEARVAAAIALGDSERDAAQRLGMGLATLQAHRKRIFAKAGITRRGELIRLCAALPR